MTSPTAQQLRDLVDLAALLPELATTRTPAGSRTRRSGGLVAHSPAPVRLDVIQALDARTRVHGDDAEDRARHDRMASDHRQGLLPDLWQWARMIEAEALEACPEVPDELPATPTVASVVDWLLHHLDWALPQLWADELVADIDWWWRRLKHLHGERDEYLPRCRCCLFPIVEGDGGMWRCLGCGAETSLDAALKRLGEPLATLTQASTLTGTPRGTLKQWAADGRILPVGDAAPALYRLRDIHALVDTPPLRGRPVRAV